MKKLHLGEYELINERVNKCGIDANYFNVLLPDEHQHDVTIGHRREHIHAGHHHHEHGDTGNNHEMCIRDRCSSILKVSSAM